MCTSMSPVQRLHNGGVEIRNRHRFERHRRGAAVARLDAQLMSSEIKTHIEGTPAVGHRRRDETTRGDVEGRVPPMIDQRRAGDPHLADDLHPQNQRLAGLAPSFKRQIGPLRICANAHVTFSRWQNAYNAKELLALS